MNFKFNFLILIFKRQLVKNEINDFQEADCIVQIDNENLSSFSNRLVPSHVPLIGPNTMMSYTEQFKTQMLNKSNNSSNLVLSEILIIGNCHNQVK